MTPAVFLDRDGTLIRDKHYLSDPAQVEWYPGTIEAMEKLHRDGFKLIVVTNQSGVGRGYYSEDAVEAVHGRILRDVRDQCGFELEGFYYATYNPDCPADMQTADERLRKPQPGMLNKAAGEHDLDLSRSFMVGDKLSDVVAGNRAGCRTVLVRTGKKTGKSNDDHDPLSTPDAVVKDFDAAVEWILKRSSDRGD